MTPALIRASVVAERVAWVRQMASQVQFLPLTSLEAFLQDPSVVKRSTINDQVDSRS